MKALRAAHPEIKIVGSAGPYSGGEMFDYLWPEMRRLGADLVDEHYYQPETFFLSQATRYDHYDREGPKVFAGEYACHGEGRKFNHFHASLLEAAFMTGLERNADLVHMATYAPLFAHVEGWQWRPDLIWFDNLRSMRTSSWHVQQLYSEYKGQNVLTVKMNGAPVTGADGQDGLFASAVADGNKVYVKVVNTSDAPQAVELAFGETVVAAVERVDFTSELLYEDNTLDAPDRIAPVHRPWKSAGKTHKVEIPAQCFSIFVFEK